jgi:hypothetical protein
VPNKPRSPAKELAREIQKASMTFRISLTALLDRMDVDPTLYYSWLNGVEWDVYVSVWRRVMAVIDELRNDPARKMEAEAEAIYNADFPLRRRTVK